MESTVDKFASTLSIPIIDGLYDECSHQNSLILYLNFNQPNSFRFWRTSSPDTLLSDSLQQNSNFHHLNHLRIDSYVSMLSNHVFN